MGAESKGTMETDPDPSAEHAQSRIAEAIVKFIENHGVRTYSVRRSPTSITILLPNEPDGKVETYVQALKGRLQEIQFDSNPDQISRDPRDERSIIIEMKPADARADRDIVVHKLREEEPELRRRGVEKLTLFGSTVLGKPYPNDVDVLMRFRPGLRLSAFDIAGLQLYLEDKLGRRVDISTETTFPSAWKETVARTGIVIFGS